MKKVVAVLFAFSIIFVSSALVAEEVDASAGPQSVSVQNRKHTMTNEFGVWIGSLPLDAFEKGLTFSGAYTLHLSDVVAWEVGQFTYSYGVESKLKEDLENISIEPTHFEVVRYFATSSIVLKPVYGKMSFLNRALFYGEIFFLLGGGFGQLTTERRLVLHGGAGFRLYAGKHVSFRLDIRDYMFMLIDDIQNELWLGLGASLSFG